MKCKKIMNNVTICSGRVAMNSILVNYTKWNNASCE